MTRYRIVTKKSRAENIRRWKMNNANWSAQWRPDAPGKNGFVYIFRLGHDGLYKVGMSKNWQRRLKQFKVTNPSIVCSYSAMVTDMRLCERLVKELFKWCKKGGELYKLPHGYSKKVDNLLYPYRSGRVGQNSSL